MKKGRSEETVRSEELEDFVVTPDEYASGFYNGSQNMADYLQFLNYLRETEDPSGRCGSAFANSLGYHRRGPKTNSDYELVRKKCDSYINGASPFPIQSLSSLNSLGIFQGDASVPIDCKAGRTTLFDPSKLKPFDSSSPYFDLICFLNSVMTYAGTLSHKLGSNSNRTTTTPVLLEHNERRSWLRECLVSKLNEIGWLTPSSSSDDKKLTLKSEIWRLMRFLNYPKDGEHFSKLNFKRHLGLPSIMENAYNTLAESPQTSQGRLALMVLTDFVYLAFAIRGRYINDASRKNRLQCILPSCYERDISIIQAEEFLKIMRAVDFPELRINMRPVRHDAVSPITSWSNIIYFYDLSMIYNCREYVTERIDNIFSMIPSSEDVCRSATGRRGTKSAKGGVATEVAEVAVAGRGTEDLRGELAG